MQSQLVDIKSYFKRIQLKEDINLRPSYKLLAKLIEQHLRNIPFENINPLLGTGVELDIGAICQKLIHSDRGGYCFEHNKLFLYVLKELGFKARSLAARVTVNREAGDVNVAKSHRFNCVEIDDRLFLVDVGFGLYTPPTPIEIVAEQSLQHPYGTYKFSQENGEYQLQTYLEHEWKELYRFTLETAQEADFEVANWYLTTHHDSIFMNRLVASKINSNGRYSLSNDQLNFYPHDSKSDKDTYKLKSARALIGCLADIFGINVSNYKHLEEKLTRDFFPEQTHKLPRRTLALKAI